ncbi:MAG: hypothetical protein LBJ82_05815 [Deltaproteobacteria bacterium]|nr:hypothetical protein [Deltaproteobacteria bacterium]
MPAVKRLFEAVLALAEGRALISISDKNLYNFVRNRKSAALCRVKTRGISSRRAKQSARRDLLAAGAKRRQVPACLAEKVPGDFFSIGELQTGGS